MEHLLYIRFCGVVKKYIKNLGEFPEIHRAILKEFEKRISYLNRKTKKREAKIEWLSFLKIYSFTREERIQIKRAFIKNCKSFYYRNPDKEIVY